MTAGFVYDYSDDDGVAQAEGGGDDDDDDDNAKIMITRTMTAMKRILHINNIDYKYEDIGEANISYNGDDDGID